MKIITKLVLIPAALCLSFSPGVIAAAVVTSHVVQPANQPVNLRTVPSGTQSQVQERATSASTQGTKNVSNNAKQRILHRCAVITQDLHDRQECVRINSHKLGN